MGLCMSGIVNYWIKTKSNLEYKTYILTSIIYEDTFTLVQNPSTY
jgi:hypothetical protein